MSEQTIGHGQFVTDRERRPQPLPTRARLLDLVVAAGVAAVMCLRAATPFETEARPPDWRAYGLMILIGALMLARRRYPMGILYASLVILFVYYSLGFGAVGALWPLSPALFNAALLGRWRDAAIVAGCVLAGAVAFRLLIETEASPLAAISDSFSDLFLGAAVILAGAMIRNHDQLESEVRAREKAVAAERDADARRRLIEQRLDIARDVHDIVAHSLSGIGVQARLAQELVDPEAVDARRSIRAIIATTSEAMTQLRQTVGTLRTAPAARPTLADVVAGVTAVDVRLIRNGKPRPPDDPVEQAVLAIAREALTNVVRHSGASEAVVTVTEGHGGVTLEVTDNGRGGDYVEGNGIVGMRERAMSAGGRLRVEPGPERGFHVVAELPT